MSNLPPKPEFSRPPSTWPESSDDRRQSGPGRSSPDRYSHQRDDRDWDRDRDARERSDRGNRSRYAPPPPLLPPRSPPPPRSTDTYIAGSRDTYHARGYRDDPRARDDRRRDRDRDRDRDRAYYQRPPHRYSPDRPSSTRRGYPPRESDWPNRDDYRRGRDWDRGRSRDRDEPRTRDRDPDRRNASPTYCPAPLSPHYHGSGAHSPPRRPQSSYPPRGRRSASPRSIGSRSPRSSPMSRARPEVVDPHPPRDTVRPPRSPSPRKRTPSPRHRSHSVSSPTRSHPESRSPVLTTQRHLQPPEPSPLEISPNVQPEPEPIQVERPSGGNVDAGMDVDTIAEPLSKGKDRSDDQDGVPHGKVESPVPSASPMELEQSMQPPETAIMTAPMPSSEPTVTQPYLPTIPRYEPKPKFSAAYEAEYNRLEAHRAHAAAECRRCSKASRRAFHELEMTTLDLRAAQHRRELAESHRKKAHHGQLGIDAETVQWTT